MPPPHHKGVIYEAPFELVLEALEKEGQIDGWQATEKYSEEDRAGIDYLVEADGKIVPFQITSTQKEARGKSHLKRQGIAVLFLVKKGEFKPPKLIKSQIMKAVVDYEERSRA